MYIFKCHVLALPYSTTCSVGIAHGIIIFTAILQSWHCYYHAGMGKILSFFVCVSFH